MYDTSVPVLIKSIESLKHILAKSVEHAKNNNLDESKMFNHKLAEDMWPLVRQVQSVSDNAKGIAARLAGVDVPSMPDNEKSFPELQERLDKTLAFLRTIKPEQVNGSEEKIVRIEAVKLEFPGKVYLLGFGLPNLFFHVTTAYSILRNFGVPLSKVDYLAAGKSFT